MTGPLAKLQASFIAVGAILAGGQVFKEAVSAATDFHVEVGKLSTSMGISEGAAVGLKMALGDLYVDSDTTSAAIGKLVQTINSSPEKFEALGISLVDSKGKTKDMLTVMLEANGKINQFAVGTDRSRAAAYLYGKQWQEVQKILGLTREKLEAGAEKARSLGIELNANDITEYRAAMNDTNDVLEAMNIRVGMALIPSLKNLAVYFADIGGPVVDAMVWAFKHLIQFLDETVTMLRLVWNDAKYVFDQITNFAGTVGAVLVNLAKGNISMVAEIGKDGNRQAIAAEKSHQEEYERLNKEHADRIVKLWAKAGDEKTKAQTGNANTGNRRFTLTDNDKGKKEAADPSYMSTYEARLAAIKNLYEQENSLREFSKEQELTYWRELQDNLELTSKDSVTIAKRTATLELEIRRSAATESRALDAVMLDSKRSAALAQIELEQQQANFAREDKQITQLQLLELEEQFARRRFEIEYQSLLERQELAKNDPNTSPAALAQIKEQMLQIERQYQLQKGVIGQGKKKEEGGLDGLFGDVGDSFSSAAKNMLTTATTLRQQLANVFKSIYTSFITNLVTNPLSQWISSKAQMLAIEMGWSTAKKSLDVAGSASTVAIKTAETGTVVTEDAIQAGTGAAKSQAGIPVIGPILALAAMAAIFAAVSGMGGKRKSAAGGFDIPRGLNPLTQLHEEEMVLPKTHANTIRRLGETGGLDQQGVSVTNNFNIQAMDGVDVKRVLLNNHTAVANALKRSVRNFVPR